MRAYTALLALAAAQDLEQVPAGSEAADDSLLGSSRRVKKTNKFDESVKAAMDYSNFKSPLVDVVRKSTDLNELLRTDPDLHPDGIVPTFRQSREISGFGLTDEGTFEAAVPPAYYPHVADPQSLGSLGKPVFSPPPFYTQPPSVDQAPRTSNAKDARSSEVLSGQLLQNSFIPPSQFWLPGMNQPDLPMQSWMIPLPAEQMQTPLLPRLANTNTIPGLLNPPNFRADGVGLRPLAQQVQPLRPDQGMPLTFERAAQLAVPGMMNNFFQQPTGQMPIDGGRFSQLPQQTNEFVQPRAARGPLSPFGGELIQSSWGQELIQPNGAELIQGPYGTELIDAYGRELVQSPYGTELIGNEGLAQGLYHPELIQQQQMPFNIGADLIQGPFGTEYSQYGRELVRPNVAEVRQTPYGRETIQVPYGTDFVQAPLVPEQNINFNGRARVMPGNEGVWVSDFNPELFQMGTRRPLRPIPPPTVSLPETPFLPNTLSEQFAMELED